MLEMNFPAASSGCKTVKRDKINRHTMYCHMQNILIAQITFIMSLIRRARGSIDQGDSEKWKNKSGVPLSVAEHYNAVPMFYCSALTDRIICVSTAVLIRNFDRFESPQFCRFFWRGILFITWLVDPAGPFNHCHPLSYMLPMCLWYGQNIPESIHMDHASIGYADFCHE